MADDATPPDPGGPGEPRPFVHAPVMVDLVVDLLRDVPDGLYVDATLGGGSHAEAVLDAHPGLRLLGLDRDDAAIAAATRRLARFGDRVHIVRTGFDQLEQVVTEHLETADPSHTRPGHTRPGHTRPGGATAVLFDLGVSSPQLDEDERGFSYRSGAPLDMRMDRRQAFSAVDVVNEYSFPQLARVIETYGEERFAGRIARAIVDARPIQNTAHLAEVVRAAIPAAARRTGGHPAKRTFQAIRIEVNRELDQLAEALEGAMAVLAPGGRMVVMSYHSLEDRMVKQTFRDAETGGCTCPPGLPCVCGAEPTVRLLKRGAWKATDDEIAANRRAESVRIRAVERIPESA
ncbi:16S rRNA (cytosine(1402)-N(4))-methyltransferase RsmH [Dermatobacter hominis]|uniref:16S rRNA (cytosine(1402)-N(4))-methyltransferase RsmH n=1 Tax=Dermatobacter hominis TaxID=2884263 RepID=UPI001D11DC02|nr:16S rRNA (cytosine(1402)-N(4))-methyltransferase RsmH [Dermatobacter hominis]UDY35970.1 16S rRNA (cytosine(1402)-N(4))-methyltransferase RsmH [Dermatobacter hominis]